jgi:DNA-binding response OmpR family regulator
MILTPTRILLVEDELEIAKMLRLFFNWSGYEMYHAADGKHALRLAAEMMPHVVLMDISLPDIDGYALTVKLRWRPRTAHIPIIFLTKWNTREHRRTAFSMGADDYISKPFNLKELLLRVQNSIAHAARENLTDLRTGLPGAFTARERLAAARQDPQQAIIEVRLDNAIPFRNAYGTTASARVTQSVGQLLLGVVNQKDDHDGFIGYVDEDHFIILTMAALAQSIAEQIVAVFNDRVAGYYTEMDRARGALLFNSLTHPFMRLRCNVSVAGAEQHELT